MHQITDESFGGPLDGTMPHMRVSERNRVVLGVVWVPRAAAALIHGGSLGVAHHPHQPGQGAGQRPNGPRDAWKHAPTWRAAPVTRRRHHRRAARCRPSRAGSGSNEGGGRLVGRDSRQARTASPTYRMRRRARGSSPAESTKTHLGTRAIRCVSVPGSRTGEATPLFPVWPQTPTPSVDPSCCRSAHSTSTGSCQAR